MKTQLTCNADIKVTHVLRNPKDRLFVRVEFLVAGRRYERLIPAIKTGTTALLQYIPEQVVFPGTSPGDVRRYIKELIDYAIAEQEEQILLMPGYNLIESRWIYVLGNQVLNGWEGLKAYPNLQDAPHIDFNREYTMNDSLSWLELYCAQGEDSVALYLACFSPFHYPILKRLGLTCTNAQYIGSSGLGKTTNVLLLTKFSDDDDASCNLVSGLEKIAAKLNQYASRAFLIDDLNKGTPREREKKADCLSAIIQTTSSGGAKYIKDTLLEADTLGLIVTGEELLKYACMINRCVVIHMEKMLDIQVREELERLKPAYVNFVLKYLAWLCENLERLFEEIEAHKEKIYKLGRVEKTNSKSYEGYIRILNHYKTMRITRYCLRRFLEEHAEPDYVDRFSKRSRHAIEKAIDDTFESVHRRDDFDLLHFILGVFKSDEDKVVAKSFKNYPKEGKIFYRNKKYFYFRGQDLQAYLQEKGIDWSVKRLSSQLSQYGLLKCGIELSEPLSKANRERYKTGKTRFYRLKIDALIQYLLEQPGDIFGFYNSPIKELNGKC